MELFETVRRQLSEAQDEVVALRAAVQLHHDQRGDNRCHLDDMKLYHDVLGEGVDPYAGSLPPDADMEESCRRYIRQRRCPGPDGVVPLPGGMTIQQLTDEVVALRAEIERLRAREADLVSDVELLGRVMRKLVTTCLGNESLTTSEIEVMIRRAVTSADTEFESQAAELAQAKSEVERLASERDIFRDQLHRLHRIMMTASHLTHDEVKALEGLADAAACIAINAWNAKSNTEAKCRENREFRAERGKLRDALQAIADYKPSRIGTEAWGLTAHYCQTTARNALAAHKGGAK